MRKAGMLLSLMLLVMSMTLVRAEDENEKDDNGSIVTDLPYAEEMEGEVFGALYGNIDEDIDIDIPVVEEPEKPKEETPVTRPQEERPKDEQEAGDTNGSSAGNSAGNNTEGSGNSPIYGGNASLLSLPRPRLVWSTTPVALSIRLKGFFFFSASMAVILSMISSRLRTLSIVPFRTAVLMSPTASLTVSTINGLGMVS